MAEQSRALQRYNDLLQRMLRGELNEPQRRDEYTRFASQEAARYARDVAQLSLSYYSALLELGRSYSERFFEQMLRAPTSAAQSSEAGQPRQVQLELRGAAGREAAAAFVIENKRAAPAEISFLVSDFTDLAGGGPFPAPLEFRPSRLTLGAHDEAEIQMRLPLSHERFVPGHEYRATVVVSGYDDLELVVAVVLDPQAQPDMPVEAAAASEAALREAEAPPRGPRRRSPGAGTSNAEAPGLKQAGGARPRRSRDGHAG